MQAATDVLKKVVSELIKVEAMAYAGSARANPANGGG
jgi:hypothetical protein